MGTRFISNLLSYGGASKLVSDLLPRMKAKGHDVSLLILTSDHSKYVEDLKKHGITVEILPDNCNTHIRRIKYLKKFILRGGYDVVHANLFPTFYYCAIVKKQIRSKCPLLVMTEHSTDNRRRHKSILRPVEKWIYSKYDRIISISNETQENLCAWLETETSERFTVVENGIDLSIFRDARKISRMELTNSYSPRDVLLLMVGSFTPQKNHIGIIAALEKLPENYKLLLCGEGPLEQSIREEVKIKGLEDRVSFLGFRRDIPEIMHTADLLVIPSIWEGFGLIAVEGMASGIPVAASDVPGLAGVVAGAAVTFDPLDSEQIAKAVRKSLLPNEKKIHINIGKIKSEEYDISRTVSGYLKVYQLSHQDKTTCDITR